MWSSVLEKLSCLKGIDRQFQAFGASSHRYELRRCAIPAEVEKAERELGVGLPNELRSFYLEVGNGIAGPNYGLISVADLEGYRAGEPYLGVDALRQISAQQGYPILDDREYFEVSRDALTGILPIIEEGCGHQTCLVTTGSTAGNVVYVSADGCVSETQKSMVDLYNEWLDRELMLFEVVARLMRDGYSYQQIDNELRTCYQAHGTGDRIVSIANVKKPVELFGEGNHRIYHGATHFPWYESVLKEWQRQNRK
jgi:hypothetical protein